MCCFVVQVAVILAVLVSCVAADVVLQGQSKVVRVPSEDSAIIQSHRLGGNFAYSTHEAHAYGVQTPIIKQRVVEKGVTYHHGEPVVNTHTSYVKQSVPQFGVVRTQHTVPGVQIATGQQVTTSHVTTPVQYVAGATPVQYTAGAAPVQYVSGVAPVQYVSGASPVQYVAGGAPVQFVAGSHHQVAGAPVQFVSGTPVQFAAVHPAQYVTGKAEAVKVPEVVEA